MSNPNLSEICIQLSMANGTLHIGSPGLYTSRRLLRLSLQFAQHSRIGFQNSSCLHHWTLAAIEAPIAKFRWFLVRFKNMFVWGHATRCGTSLAWRLGWSWYMLAFRPSFFPRQRNSHGTIDWPCPRLGMAQNDKFHGLLRQYALGDPTADWDARLISKVLWVLYDNFRFQNQYMHIHARCAWVAT